jgi:hypothetical protein
MNELETYNPFPEDSFMGKSEEQIDNYLNSQIYVDRIVKEFKLGETQNDN